MTDQVTVCSVCGHEENSPACVSAFCGCLCGRHPRVSVAAYDADRITIPFGQERGVHLEAYGAQARGSVQEDAR